MLSRMYSMEAVTKISSHGHTLDLLTSLLQQNSNTGHSSSLPTVKHIIDAFNAVFKYVAYKRKLHKCQNITHNIKRACLIRSYRLNVKEDTTLNMRDNYFSHFIQKLKQIIENVAMPV